MHGNPCSDPAGWDKDGEAVICVREPDDLVVEDLRPEGGGTIGVLGAQDDRPEAKHDDV